MIGNYKHKGHLLVKVTICTQRNNLLHIPISIFLQLNNAIRMLGSNLGVVITPKGAVETLGGSCSSTFCNTLGVLLDLGVVTTPKGCSGNTRGELQ